MSVQMTLIHVYLRLSSSPGMTIRYFCHEVKRGGGGPRLNVIMTLTLFWKCPLTKAENGRTGGDIPGSLPDCGL